MAAGNERHAVPLSQCFSALVDQRAEPVRHFTESLEFQDCWRSTQCSSAAALSPTNWAALPHTKRSLKAHVRSAVTPSVRRLLWLGVLAVTEDDSVLFAKAFGEPTDDDEQRPAQLDVMYGWPFDLDTIPSYHLRPIARPAFDRVLTAMAYAHPHLSMCPLLPPLAHVALHFTEEWECFALMDRLLRRQAWLDQNPAQLRASRTTFRMLCNSHQKAAVQELQQLRPQGMSEEEFLSALTQHWYTWPFYRQPFWVVVRVVDLYMLEGPKVLYRLSLTALKLFSSHHRTSISSADLEEVIPKFLSAMSRDVQLRWFMTSFAIPHLPWRALLRTWSQNSVQHSTGSSDNTDGRIHTLTSYRRSIVPDPTSDIITSDELWGTLWAWLPDWITCEAPNCIFRASRDGYNLRTLYRKSDKIQPIVLLVRTTQAEVFGAFITSELSERHNAQFFGNGETFLFSLLPEAHSYHWSAETDLILHGTDQELAIGSGGGAYGLWLDEDLDKGMSGSCLAFHNLPLSSSGSHFSCSAVEVYSCV